MTPAEVRSAQRYGNRRVRQAAQFYETEITRLKLERSRLRATVARLQKDAARMRGLIEELDGHEGAEGWSEDLQRKLDAHYATKEQP